ncbi:hypothetical protein BDB00DRAFT_612303 [Zychaea mexicana]|uniref:uncharacterized protein n=1 Tax=Zychaea mexicana TaxID=64656 RepID=UPI0022FE7051|nr:uncharacterized protein BDB00DRAFT_612303 [Zychaea mexicana]KAI9489444.1 hypothetical protein BDB00DRAFT_612303 [Zychaea mexicana]
MLQNLPYDLQQVICEMAIGPNGNDPFAFRAMRVCKLWAHYVCSVLYRNYIINDYLQFVGFVKVVSSDNPLLPYGAYIRSVDLTAVNRYGIDMRAHKLIKHCPNLLSVTLGHPTSVKPSTIMMMARHCKKLHSLQIGGLESHPFMLECNFACLKSLRHVDIHTTPLTGSSLNSLPITLERVRLMKLDSLEDQDLATFVKNRKKSLKSLAIIRCVRFKGRISDVLQPLTHLEQLELVGATIDDKRMEGLFDLPFTLKSLRLCDTQISEQTILALAAGRLKVHHLDISHNPLLTDDCVKSLLLKRHL